MKLRKAARRPTFREQRAMHCNLLKERYVMSMLLVTPWHKATESLLGYALRVSEKNGYDSPWHILTLAGLPQGKMDTAGFPVEQFAMVLGRSPEALKNLAYCDQSGDGLRQFQILGQPLGGTLHSAPFRLGKPQICPQCVKEHEFIDAFFDLSMAIACPDHGKTLVSTCPECHKPLNWFRPGRLTCKCGADLSKAATVDVSCELKELMSVMKAKVHGRSLDAVDNPCNFPLKEMDAVSLRMLLDKVTELGRLNQRGMGKTDSDISSTLQSASEVLRDWPYAYHEFLRRQKSPVGQTYKVTQYYEDLFSSLLNRHNRIPGADFLFDEFVRFAKEEWNGVISWQLDKGDKDKKRFVSKSEFAAIIGVDKRTLKKWGEKNLLEMESVKQGSQNRYVIDTLSVKTPVKGEGKTFGEREAAALVGLPVSVLKSLRDSGHFNVRFLPTNPKAFHELDLVAFKEELSSLCDVLHSIPEGTMTLADVMRLKFRNPDGKADFVRAVLAGTIDTIGRNGGNVSELRFHVAQVEYFLRDRRSEAEGDTWSLTDAARFLHCDTSAISALIEEGLLCLSTERRVTVASVTAFDTTYVSLARIAKDAGTSSRKLQSTLTNLDVNLKMVNRSPSKAQQPFMLRTERNLLPL